MKHKILYNALFCCVMSYEFKHRFPAKSSPLKQKSKINLFDLTLCINELIYAPSWVRTNDVLTKCIMSAVQSTTLP